LLAVIVLGAGAAGAASWLRANQHARERAEALRLSEQGRFAEAQPSLRRALERNGSDAEVVKALARGTLGTQQFKEAEGYLARWCTLQPDLAEPFELHFGVAQQMGKVEDLVADGERLLAIAPNNPQVQQQVLALLTTNGRHADVERICRRQLQTNPGVPHLLYYLAEACHGQGKEEEARAILDQLLQDQPRFTAALLLRAVLYLEAGQNDKAIPVFRQVLAQAPDTTPASYYLGLALKRSGKSGEAGGQMTEVLRQQDVERLLIDKDFQPDNLALKARAAEALLQSGRAGEGARLVQEILLRDPGNVAALRLRDAYLVPKVEKHKTSP
jgi:tetratricopeptide (TPR) repeat protein